MLSTLHLPVANAVVNPAAAAASAAAAKRLHRRSKKRFSATRGVGGKKSQKQTNEEPVEVATANAFISMSDLDQTEGMAVTDEPEQGDTVKDDTKPSDACEMNAVVSWQRLPPRRVKLLLEGKKEGVMGRLTIRKGNTRVRRMRWLNQPAKQF